MLRVSGVCDSCRTFAQGVLIYRSGLSQVAGISVEQHLKDARQRVNKQTVIKWSLYLFLRSTGFAGGGVHGQEWYPFGKKANLDH